MHDVTVGSRIRKWVAGLQRGTRPAAAPRPESEYTVEALEGRILLAADLTGLVTAHTLADPSVPTNVETATVQVKNQGTTAATVSTQVRVYASTDSTFSTSDVLLGTTTTTALSAGSSRNVLVNLAMPNTLAAGTYKLLSRVDATNVVAEGTVGEANNVKVGPTFTVAWQFGAVPGRTGNTVLTLRDADGTAVTFRLTGPGVGTVVKDGTNWDLKLTGTTTTSAVLITTSGGNGRVLLNDVNAVAPLASFTAATTDVNGTVAINGTITTLTLGDVLGGNVAAKSITTFTARNLTNAKLYIGTTLGQDGKLGGTSTNLDTYGLGRLGALVLTGSMTGSTVRVSVNPVDGTFGNGNDRFVTGTPTGIGSIKIQGTLSADSRFISPTKPTTYLLAGQTKSTTGDSHFVTNLTNLAPIAANDAFTLSKGGASGLVKDINPGPAGSRPIGFPPTNLVTDLVDINGTLYFTAFKDGIGNELWKSDGTAAGTVLVKDIVAGTSGSDPMHLTNVNGTLFFTAQTAAHGRELWKSNGTAAGTVLVKDINPGAGSGFMRVPNAFINVNGTLYFAGNNGLNGHELWKSNGTAAGTVMVKDISLGLGDGLFVLPDFTIVNINGTLYFAGFNNSSGLELWKSDGTAAGTVLVKDIASGSSSSPRELTAVNGTLFFAADDGVGGYELWKSNGTAAGTVLVKDIWTGFQTSTPTQFTNMNGTLFFTADNGINGRELWKSNGTAAGTVLVKDINPGTPSSLPAFPDTLSNVGGKLFFRSTNTFGYSVLWVSNGTEAGTVALTSPGGPGSFATGIINVNGIAFYTTGSELWKSDGTVAGTKQVMAGVQLEELINVNGTVFFRGYQASTGYELWKVGGQANALLNGNVLSNDRDPNGNPITAALVTGPTKGTLTLNANGTFTYRPNAGFIGTDTFTYRASDGALQSNLATVTITVTA